MTRPSFTIGIEEEYQTIDPVTRDLRCASPLPARILLPIGENRKFIPMSATTRLSRI